MSIRVFISHSVAPWELALVNSVADVTGLRGAVPIIPDRDWDPSMVELPGRIKAQVEHSDYVIAIASQWGQHLDSLNQEITYSHQLSPPRPSVVVADSAIAIAPGHDCVRMDRSNPLDTLAEVSQRIERVVLDKNTQEVLRGLLLGGLALLFLSRK